MDNTPGAGAIAAPTAGTTLRFRRHFAASPERVFVAWTHPQALKLWWCPAGWEPMAIDVDLRVGGRYRLEMRRCCGSSQIAAHGCFRDIQPGRFLAYSWHWEGAFPGMPPTEVRVSFRPSLDGTELELEQDTLALPLCARHTIGWLHACDRLNQLFAITTARNNVPQAAMLEGSAHAKYRNPPALHDAYEDHKQIPWQDPVW